MLALFILLALFLFCWHSLTCRLRNYYAIAIHPDSLYKGGQQQCIPLIERREKVIFSVSQLNRQAKQLLETHLPLIWVSGELSSLSRPSSGHWYFTLKDERAQVRCAMFKNANQRLRWQVETGKQVLVRARVSLYEGRGDYQLIVEHMEEAGTGALQRAFELLKSKLQNEGLFDPDRKQALPAAPKHIGVITSPTGAAIQDILSVLKRRYPIAPVSIMPVAVQGESAAGEINQALRKAEQSRLFDVLIITRGGGSMEDLWPFNDEALARTIAACKTPIISAVGHEIDFTICDFVADMRAPTPSASAEIATPDISEWQIQIDRVEQQLQSRIFAVLSEKTRTLGNLSKRLRHPQERINLQTQQYAALKKRLQKAMRYQLHDYLQQLSHSSQRLNRSNPKQRLAQHQQALKQIGKRLQTSINNSIQTKQQSIKQFAGLLQAVSPLNVLSRGYAVTRDEQGKAMTDSAQIKVGDTVNTQLNKGYFTSQVIDIKK